MTESEFQGWQRYYEVEPWGEERADARQLVSEARWSHMLAGGTREPPKPFFPYFDAATGDPATIAAETAAFEDAIEYLPGGGCRWKPEVRERLIREGKIKDE